MFHCLWSMVHLLLPVHQPYNSAVRQPLPSNDGVPIASHVTILVKRDMNSVALHPNNIPILLVCLHQFSTSSLV